MTGHMVAEPTALMQENVLQIVLTTHAATCTKWNRLRWQKSQALGTTHIWLMQFAMVSQNIGEKIWLQ